MKGNGKRSNEQRVTSKSKSVSSRSTPKRKDSQNFCFSNLPKESGRLSASFYAKR